MYFNYRTKDELVRAFHEWMVLEAGWTKRRWVSWATETLGSQLVG
ncbi:hypothetical protein [Kribbella pittospori]|nr:hypothetical protein [Kribbella pittospori]